MERRNASLPWRRHTCDWWSMGAIRTIEKGRRFTLDEFEVWTAGDGSRNVALAANGGQARGEAREVMETRRRLLRGVDHRWEIRRALAAGGPRTRHHAGETGTHRPRLFLRSHAPARRGPYHHDLRRRLSHRGLGGRGTLAGGSGIVERPRTMHADPQTGAPAPATSRPGRKERCWERQTPTSRDWTRNSRRSRRCRRGGSARTNRRPGLSTSSSAAARNAWATGSLPSEPERADSKTGALSLDGTRSRAESDRRFALAKWICAPQNPLTPRVLANRIWHYHFGRGLVDTPSDFGYMGGGPTHPELLDWLAQRLQENGWHWKPLHRLIMTSQAYQQSAAWREDAARQDGDSRQLWRFPPRH